jgi:hypothetical protein
VADRIQPLSPSAKSAKTFSDHAATSYGLEGCGSSALARPRRDDELADRDYAAFILDASPDEHRQRDRVHLI